jgi:hypothetical protein
MELDRRQLLATGGACLASCGAGARLAGEEPRTLDRLLAEHAGVLPENGGGANHYPMAAEALEALGHADALDDSWRTGASIYPGPIPRAAPLPDDDLQDALGDYERFGDWLDHFEAELAREPWRGVVGRWAPRLAPGISAAAFHGVIRTGHAARALRRAETDARRRELALALSYWAARYTELPTVPGAPGPPRGIEDLPRLEHPWLDDPTDVGFHDVVGRMTAAPLAPAVSLDASGRDVRADLDAIVRAGAAGLLEMLVQERHRIWILHSVTGPAAVELLLPEVDAVGARVLTEYARQAVVALYAAYGAPYEPGAHLRDATEPWPALVRRAAESGSVHGVKLLEALVRFRHVDDRLARSVAAQWFEWT